MQVPTVNRLLESLPVKRKLLVLTLLTSAVALLLSATVYSAYQLHALRDDGEREFALVAALVAEQSRLALRHGDSTPLQSTLERLARERLIEAALVAGDDGRPIAVFNRAGRAVPVTLSAAEADAASGRLVSYQSVLADGEAVGRIYLRGDASGLYSRMTEEGLVGGGVMLVSFAVALLLSARLRRTISEPLERMSVAARGGAEFLPPAPDTGQGDELGVLANALREFSERLHRQDDERDSQHRLQSALMRSSDAALLLADADGSCTPLNAGLERLLQQPPGLAGGDRLWRLVHPADAAGVAEWLARARVFSGVLEHDLRLQDSSGAYRPVRGRAQRLEVSRPSCRNAGRLLVALEDRSRLARLADDLEQALSRLDGLHHCTEDALFELDARWRVTRASESAARMLGSSCANLVGQHFADFDPGFVAGDVALGLESSCGKAPLQLSTTLVRRDGTRFPARARWLALAGGGRVIVCVRDLSTMTRLQRALDAAADAERSAVEGRDTLIRNIGHDVRNPVTALVAASDLLRREQSEVGRLRCIEMVDNSSRALLDVVDGLCDLARLGEGCLAPDNISFDSRPVLESVLDVHAARAGTRGIDLALHVAASVPSRLRGDPRLLRQLLAMLVGSVVRFAERDAVTVHVSADDLAGDHRLRMLVRGHGAGLAAELRGHLGLEQGAESTPDAGHPLPATPGPTLAQALCDAMRGRLELAELPGGCFQLMLELPTTTADGDSVAVAPGPAAGRRLLLLHGNAEVAGTLAATLADLGVAVTIADSARDAMARLRRASEPHARFDLVLLDGGLPGCEARNLLQAVRADACLADTRVLLVQHLAAEPIADPRADAVLFAPVHPSQLARALVATREDGPSQGLPPGPPPEGPRGPDTRQRVLVVDDDGGVQAALVLMLESLGYAADAVADGTTALAALRQRRYDVVMLDCRMPVMDGFELADQVGQDFEVPVIAMSGCLTGEDERRLGELGVRACLAKPIRERSLLAVLRRCVPSPPLH